jgi:RHS repeat-associated protein
LNPVQETSGATILAKILTGLGADEFLTRTDVAAGLTSNFLTDALGSPLAVTDNTGVVQTEYIYEAFGRATAIGASNSSSYQYTGRENDGTGIYYYRARYYHPALQRFISEDPIEFTGGDYNLYAYVGNKPLNLIDPKGLWGVGIIGSGSMEIGAVGIGAGVTGSIGGGVFGGGDGGMNLGGFGSLGGFAGGPGYGPSYPGDNNNNVVGGAFGGFGGGAFATNAKCAGDLKGPFDTYSFNIGVGPIKISAQFGISGGTWIGSVTVGPGFGITGSGYPTNTWTTN